MELEAKEFKQEHWARSIKFDGNKTFEPVFKNEEEKEAANKIVAALVENNVSKVDAKTWLTILAEKSTEELKLLANNPQLARIWMDPEISPHQKKIRSIPYIRKMREDIADVEKNVSYLEKKKLGAEYLLEWGSLNPVLQKNDCSRLHKLAQEYIHGRVYFLAEKTKTDMALFKDIHPFVVQNDWAKAFENATDYAEGEINLPFNICAFEFRITGLTVIVIALQPEGESVQCIGFVESKGVWFCGEEKLREDDVFNFAWKEIRAICIALEAEAANHELVRAPEKLNRLREAEGKLPLYAYHVVKLSGRHRASAGQFGGTHRSPRLHFRRGHWRHFSTHKTWIKWMLVGNPELGFIDKEYRL